MSTYYHLEAWAGDEAAIAPLDAPGARFHTRNTHVSEIVDAIIYNMPGSFASTPFPWYSGPGVFEAHTAPTPEAHQRHRPQAVLKDLQWIEREVAKHPRRYPAVWSFVVPGGQGQEETIHRSLNAFYRGRAVRLFGDGAQCWARETTPGPRDGIHHELTREAAVTVTLDIEGPPVDVRILRAPMTVHYGEVMSGLKGVCLVGMQRGAVVVGQYIH